MSSLAVLAGTGAGLAIVGSQALNAVALVHQRRQARMWRVLRLHVPSDVQAKAEGLTALTTSLWGKMRRSPLLAFLYGQPRAVWEVRADATGTHPHWVVPADETKYMQQLLQTCIPGVEIEEIGDYLAPAVPKDKAVAVTQIRLQRHSAYPINSDYRRQFAEALMGVMDGCRDQGELTLQVVLRPVRDKEWKPQARLELAKAEGKARLIKENGPTTATIADSVTNALGSVFDSVSGQGSKGGAAKPTRDPVTRLERTATRDTPAKLLSPGFAVSIRIMATAKNRREACSLCSRVAALFATLNGHNVFLARAYGPLANHRWIQRRWARRMCPTRVHSRTTILTPDELASIIAPISATATQETNYRIIELRRPPLAEGIHICDGQYRGQRVPVRMKPSDLDTHLCVFGMTGHGKGVIQENFFREIARAGMGGVYIDPLGGSVRKLLASIPDERMDDVVYIEAGHPDWATPLNFLAGASGDDQESIAADAVNLYAKLWSDAWGKSTEEALRAATIATIQSGGALPEVELVLSDPSYRKSVLHKVSSAPIRHYLETLPDKVTETLRPPLNKLHELLWYDSILAMIGQPDSLNWDQVIKERRLLLVNLNKGSPKIGQMGASLIAGIVWSRIGRAGLSVPVSQRVRFIQVADEFKDVAARTPEEFETAFAQYRQFLLPVLAAGQYPAQLPERLVNALTGNVGSKLTLREDQPHSKDCIAFVGGGGQLRESDLNNLPKLVGYANLVVEDRPTGLFTAWAPPFSQPIRDPDQAAQECFKRWARPRAKVLAEINKRIQQLTSGNSVPEID